MPLFLPDTDFKLLLDSAQKMLAGRQLSLKVPDRLQMASAYQVSNPHFTDLETEAPFLGVKSFELVA